MIVDSSALIGVFRDRTGKTRERLEALLGGEELMLTRFTELELLKGCRDEAEWLLITDFMDSQTFVECEKNTWEDAARIFYDLRRKGKTVRSILDCCIAQLALENELPLIHNDRDFETIAEVRRLRHFVLETTLAFGLHEPDTDPLS
ncbi:MAG: PIN domain-containing protein [Hyphomicrobiales bacterium]|nr:PIN domain-containing protein [Hyphomicrobiales bacterium]